MNTGVLVHGCNLGAENWRYVAWGDAPDNYGRIPMGVLLALETRASVIVFGTGASQKDYRFPDSDKFGQSLYESEYAREYLDTHFENLSHFNIFKNRLGRICDAAGCGELKSFVFDRLQVETASRNTIDEVRNAGEIFLKHDVERVIIVSSPSHVIRAFRDAISIFHGDRRFRSFRDNLWAVPSITCYEGSTVDDVVVIEPPHRPDRHVIPTHRRIQRMLNLQKLPYERLVAFIEEFDDLLQRYEHELYG